MDASLASFQARFATFGPAATKTRRSSSRSKKAGTKSKSVWPLSSPTAEDLAFAGFVWKPTSVSPDNVQCHSCACQLDGWEDTDIPAYEHLTHAPTCGFAITACIRLRNGDPGRTEDDPTSAAMLKARRDTFGDYWPLEGSTGYPNTEQMAAAGWIYDPTNETPDGVICPYCALALDAWDAGDDPMEEHRRRSSDCLFFTLSQLYNAPPQPPAKKGKRASTTAKRAPAKAKRASTRTSTASTASKKSTRGKKRTSEAVEEPDYSEVLQPSAKRIRSSSVSSFPDGLPVGTPKKTPREIIDSTAQNFEMPSLPVDLPAGTPKKTPTHNNADLEVPRFEMSSPPASLLVGTPKRTPPMLRDAESPRGATAWVPTDLESFFNSEQEIRGFLNDVAVDAGLDNIAAAGANVKDLHAAVMAGLTDRERQMTVEQWVLYNAQRGAEKLRMTCEQQIGAFEAEGERALAMLEGITVY